jgi:hypothetical protein
MLKRVITPVVAVVVGFATGFSYCVWLVSADVAPLNEKAQYLSMVVRETRLLRALEREDAPWLKSTWLPRSERLLSELEQAEVACPLTLRAMRVMGGEFTCGYFDNMMPQLVKDAHEELRALRSELDAD